MKQLKLDITARSPLAIGRQRPGGSVSEVEHYIPGSVIRGAIAAHILALTSQTESQSVDAGDEDDDFVRLFNSAQPAIFHNAYPATAQISSDQFQTVDSDIRVIPATAVSSKTDPGFLTTDNSGVFDTLIDRLCAAKVKYPYEPTLADSEHSSDQVEPFSGFYSRKGSQNYAHNSNTRFLTRVGINRRRAVAADQILYSLEVLNESYLVNRKTAHPQWNPTVFRGMIWVPDDAIADCLEQLINLRSQTLRIGGSGSRGLGKVDLHATLLPVADDLEKRLSDFNQALKERWQHLWSILANQGDLTDWTGRTFFTLDLQSDAVLTEKWRRTTVISEAMLGAITDAPEDQSLKLHVAYSNYSYRSGWNAAWGLMKDQELMTSKGSVYLFSTTEPQAWYKALRKLEQNGIGERTSEGFGQIRVCDEFHQVMRENPA